MLLGILTMGNNKETPGSIPDCNGLQMDFCLRDLSANIIIPL